MREKYTLLFLAFLIISCSEKQTTEKTDNRITWSEVNRIEHLKNVADTTTWNIEMLESDKQLLEIGDLGPFEVGAFPVPNYELIGKKSFKGMGNKAGEFQINDKKILMNSFFIGKNELNDERLGDIKDETFFQILILTDSISNEKMSIVLSRNHPDYLGQGFVKTKDNRIDYLAFQTPENNCYAIVNARIFDLKYGKTILVAPQKDKTLRFLQKNQGKIIASDSIKKYTDKLITEKSIIEFFEHNGNI